MLFFDRSTFAIIFSATYKFIRECYQVNTRIWKSVRQELDMFKNLMIFLVSPWRMPWCSMVTATDSNLIGYGVTRAPGPVDEVRKHGRVSERARFKRCRKAAAVLKL
jgi:hypothetical protein